MSVEGEPPSPSAPGEASSTALVTTQHIDILQDEDLAEPEVIDTFPMDGLLSETQVHTVMDQVAGMLDLGEVSGERRRAYLRAALRQLENTLIEKLSPDEAEVYQLPINGMLAVLQEARATDAMIHALKACPTHEARAKLIVRWWHRSKETGTLLAGALEKRLYASRTTVTEKRINPALSPDDVVTALRVAYGDELLPSESNVHIATPRPQVSHVRTLSDGSRVVVYAERASEARESIGVDWRLRATVRLRQAQIVLGLDGRIEIHGPSAMHDRVSQQFMDDLDRGGSQVDLTSRPVTNEQLHKLMDLLGAKMTNEKYLPPDEEHSGIGMSSVSLSGRVKAESLTDTPGYKALPPDREIETWRLKVPFKGEWYSVYYNWRQGRISMLEGRSSADLVTHVLSAINEIQSRS